MGKKLHACRYVFTLVIFAFFSVSSFASPLVAAFAPGENGLGQELLIYKKLATDPENLQPASVWLPVATRIFSSQDWGLFYSRDSLCQLPAESLLKIIKHSKSRWIAEVNLPPNILDNPPKGTCQNKTLISVDFPKPAEK